MLENTVPLIVLLGTNTSANRASGATYTRTPTRARTLTHTHTAGVLINSQGGRLVVVNKQEAAERGIFFINCLTHRKKDSHVYR